MGLKLQQQTIINKYAPSKNQTYNGIEIDTI